ncbi:hypothetical protein U1Q18_033499 [Sarracenia purpurea var. burkii]
MLCAGTRRNIRDVVGRSNNVCLDGNSGTFEAFRADQIEEREIVEQGPEDIAGFYGEDGSNGGNGTSLDFMVNEESLENAMCLAWVVEGAEEDDKECEDSNNGLFKCYKRRRISTCRS